MHGFDQAFVEMTDLVAEMEAAESDDLNEADTRLRIVDRLLINVLGWPTPQVRAEQHTDSGYMDYCVGAIGTQFVLEAKRAGKSFSLPSSSSAAVVKIPSLLSQNPAGKALKSAMLQVARYGQDRGIPITVAFNGRQLVIFFGTRTDGLPPLEGSALVFSEPTAMIADFVTLWNNLSPEGMESRSLHRTLQATIPLPPDPLAVRLNDYPGTQRRNDLQTSLQIMSDLFLGDLEDLEGLQEDFLRECYASSGALSQYAEVSKQILASRYELLSDVSTTSIKSAADKKGVTAGFTADVLQAALSNRPIILLGDVGAGKSTFIERLIHVDAKEVLGDSVSIYVDFGSSSSLTSPAEQVIDACIEQLRTKYDTNILAFNFAEKALQKDLRYFDESPRGALKGVDEAAYRNARIEFVQKEIDDRSSYLRKCFEWMRTSWHRQIVVFLDNIDQRSNEDQNAVFLIANELARAWPATVFVSLRPETFYMSERDGAISGYHPRVFTISPPRTDVMLRLRIQFALRQLRDAGRLGSFPAGIQMNSESLEAFLEVLESNLRGNDPLIRLVDNLAGGNMRRALQFITDFVGSGHIDTQKIIDIHQRFGSYTIPDHEILRSIMFGDHRYYDPDSSHVPNIFRLSRPDPKEHFLLPICLSHVQKTGELKTEHGYVTSREIYDYLQSLGYDAPQVSGMLEYAIRFRLLESTRRYGKDHGAEVFRITTVGAYAYRALATKFTYVDAISVDLPVLDVDARQSIVDARTLAERVDRVQEIASYLDQQWAYVPNNPDWEWPLTSVSLRRDIDRVRGHLPHS